MKTPFRWMIQGYKGMFDYKERERGTGGARNHIETPKLLSTVVLLGQYLSTGDDASVLSRTIPLNFSRKQSISDLEINDFKQLKV